MKRLVLIPILFLALILIAVDDADARCAGRLLCRVGNGRIADWLCSRPLLPRWQGSHRAVAAPKYRIECNGNSCRRVRVN